LNQMLPSRRSNGMTDMADLLGSVAVLTRPDKPAGTFLSPRGLDE